MIETINTMFGASKQPEAKIIIDPEPETMQAEEAVKPLCVVVPSAGRDTITKTLNGERVRHIYGDVNGTKFDFPCDRQVDLNQIHPKLSGESILSCISGIL